MRASGCHRSRAALRLIPLCLLFASAAEGQAVKGSVDPEMAPAPLTYRGLIPGLDDGRTVRERLGEPVFESRWYSYKLYYPAKDRPGLFDVLHLHGPTPEQGLANIDAASVPEGHETEERVRARLGDPEYVLRMATWSLLDYSEQGVRFALDTEGRTIGVAYFPHGRRRVPAGERSVVDLTHLRSGPTSGAGVAEPVTGLSAGVAEVVITPLEQSWLPHSFEVHDDLKARIVVLERDGLTVALVGADLFGMGFDEIEVMRLAAQEIGVEHLVLAMSHNHAAPDTIGVYGHYPAEYIAFLQRRVVEGVALATRNLRGVARIRAVSRELPMDGIRVQGLFRNARNPGVLDPTLSVMQLEADTGEALATIVHFACHVESLARGSEAIGADFPGAMADRLAGEDVGQVVFLNGAVGGMVSGDNRERNFASSTEMGHRLANLVLELLESAEPIDGARLSVERRPVQIPMVNPRFRPLYEAGLRELLDGRVTTDMLYLRIGEAQLITLPGELLPEVSFEILERMDGFPRMLIGLANDQLGYMVPPYDFRAESYEESMSQGPSAATQVRDTALRMLAGVE